ncbi:MAG: threonylcarbamoyl-AMP synthase [Gracilibacteraceae bacterium]|jgi:L-threonylcarbamoyladenylate synthase|nr:threonylcarbamoyl-AMP synthase [Gracilibacteraceae bacterium]
METVRLLWRETEADGAAVAAAVALLRAGETVAFPTETVYGLGADALNAAACRRIFAAKGRPADNPLIVHIADTAQVGNICAAWPPEAGRLAARFWPGPLTLVLPKQRAVPAEVTGGLSTVGVRMPAHPLALALIRASGLALAAPSANLSGKPSPTTAAHVWDDLGGRIPLILDGGPCRVGLESTVLDLSAAAPTVLRPGAVTREELEATLEQPVRLAEADATAAGMPKAPGMKYRHYAPAGRVILLGATDTVRQIAEQLRAVRPGERIAVLATDETLAGLDAASRARIATVYSLGSARLPDQAAARLFAGLRLADERRADFVFVQTAEESGMGAAFMNRLRKAAGEGDEQCTLEGGQGIRD